MSGRRNVKRRKNTVNEMQQGRRQVKRPRKPKQEYFTYLLTMRSRVVDKKRRLDEQVTPDTFDGPIRIELTAKKEQWMKCRAFIRQCDSVIREFVMRQLRDEDNSDPQPMDHDGDDQNGAAGTTEMPDEIEPLDPDVMDELEKSLKEEAAQIYKPKTRVEKRKPVLPTVGLDEFNKFESEYNTRMSILNNFNDDLLCAGCQSVMTEHVLCDDCQEFLEF